MDSQNIGKVSSYLIVEITQTESWHPYICDFHRKISILFHCYLPFCLCLVHLVNKIARMASPSRIRMIAKVISEIKAHLKPCLFKSIHDQRQPVVTSYCCHQIDIPHLLSQLFFLSSFSSYCPHISSPGHFLAFM